MKKLSLTQKSYITIETKVIVPQNQNKTPKKKHQQATAKNSILNKSIESRQRSKWEKLQCIRKN